MGLNNLGAMYLEGRGVERSYSKAMELFTRAASKNHAEAQVNLGTMYSKGWGCTKDLAKARQLFAIAAQFDNIYGQFELAELLMNEAQFQNCPQAVALFKQVSEKGFWRGLFREALTDYQDGNYDLALLKYEKLAARGYLQAQMNAALMYDMGEFGPAINVTEEDRLLLSFSLHKKAALQGSTNSNLKIGDYFYYGLAGNSVNEEKAATYYRLASDMGNAHGSFNLGYMHHFGIGVPFDMHIAKRFYDLGALQNRDAWLVWALSMVGWLATYPYFHYDSSLLMLDWFSEFVGYDWDNILILILCALLGVAVLLRHQLNHVNVIQQQFAR